MKNVRGGSAAKRDRLLRPRARLARVGGYAVSLDAAHGLDNTGWCRRVPRYRDDTSAPRPARCPVRHRPPAGATVHPGGVSAGHLRRRTRRPAPAPARWARRRRRPRRCPCVAQPVDQGQRLGHRRDARCRWCSRSSVASSSSAGSAGSARAPAAPSAAALKAASACGTASGSRPRATCVERVASGTSTTGTDVGIDLQPHRPRSVRRRPGERRAAEQAGRDVVGVPLELGGQAEDGVGVDARRRRGTAPRRRATPATTAAAEEPIPRPCGMPLSAATAQARRAPAELRRRRRGTRGRPGATRRWAARRRPTPDDRRVEARTPGRRTRGRRSGSAPGRRSRTPARGWRWSPGRGPRDRRRHRPSCAAAAAASTGMVSGAGAPRSPTPGP